MKVNICGIPHTVIECEDKFDVDTHFGQIDYKACEIRINKDMATEAKEETICHEMIHGILVHLGYSEQSQDEQFVQTLANAIYQGFNIKKSSRENLNEGACEFCKHQLEPATKGPCAVCSHNFTDKFETR